MSKGGHSRLTVNYWDLKNKDPGMPKFAKDRIESVVKEFHNLVEKYTKSSYQKTHTLDEPLYYKCNKRLDFMMNIYKEIIQYAYSKLSELENEMDRRS
jgi:hypothetical protein